MIDFAYEENARLEAREIVQLETEALEDEILGDKELFTRLAVSFCRWAATRGYPVEVTFLDWSCDKLRRERENQWEGGWKQC